MKVFVSVLIFFLVNGMDLSNYRNLNDLTNPDFYNTTDDASNIVLWNFRKGEIKNNTAECYIDNCTFYEILNGGKTCNCYGLNDTEVSDKADPISDISGNGIMFKCFCFFLFILIICR
jgi:hypothetical protein